MRLAKLSPAVRAEIQRRVARQTRQNTPALNTPGSVLQIGPGLRVYIELAGYKLPSINVMIGSGRQRHQAAAKREARWRVMLAGRGHELPRLAPPVEIEVIQYLPTALGIDAPNIYDKHLIDCLHDGTPRHPGLGIFQDDRPAVLRRAIRHIVLRDGPPAVGIIIRPYAAGQEETA